jgi:hypothetical protein
MSKSKFEIIKILKGEYDNTKGTGRLLLIAAFFNIPIDGFVPYLSQIATIILISIFIKRYLALTDTLDHGETRTQIRNKNITTAVITLSVVTLCVQLVWTPFVTELITLVLIGLLYAFSSKYKKQDAHKEEATLQAPKIS